MAYLSEQGYLTYLAHANKVKSFAKMKGYSAKTDRIDANMIREYALTTGITPKSSKLSTTVKKLGDLLKRRNQLVGDKKREKNRLEKEPETDIRLSISSHIEWITLEIGKIEKLLKKKEKSSKMMHDNITLLKTIPAVGSLIAQYSVAFLPELGKLSHKKIAALVGVAPFNHDSGRYKGKRFITGGRKDLRDVLYMAAVVSVRCDPQLKDFYNKLKNKGKPSKVALIAVLRKLLMRMNSVMKRKTPWQQAMPTIMP